MRQESAVSEDGYRNYLKALLDGDKGRCVAMVQDLLTGNIEIYDLYIHLFQRSMYEVGALWEANRISVAKEHLASSITESLLNLVYPRIFAAEHLGKKAIVACVANEYHQLGGKMVADIMELHGWDGYFLGANTPPEELLKLIDEKKPDLIGLSLAIYSNLDHLLRVLEMVQATFPGLPIIVGGQSFRWGGIEVISKYQSTEYVSSLLDLEKILR